MPGKGKVFVAMSGGVDSSIAATLLLEKGYEVVGVTMQVWGPEKDEVAGEGVGCCSLAAVESARQVADLLGIPFYVMNFRKLFAEKVIKYFVEEYLTGRTPNPCIACNRYLKFGAFLEKAQALGADYISTGHYACLSFDSKLGRYVVEKAVDKRKDQTYVLYNLTQSQIDRTIMPLGEYTKIQVREMAANQGLPVAQKKESQEICFVADGDYRNFLSDKAGVEGKKGPFLNLQGEIIGYHRGIPFYTIGQRRGLGLTAGERLYVVNIDAKNNTITLGPDEAVWGSNLIAGKVNFILFDSLTSQMEVEAQIRYNARPSSAIISPLPDGRVKVHFTNPQRSVTPGQAVVFYQGNYLVGGGIIEKFVCI